VLIRLPNGWRSYAGIVKTPSQAAWLFRRVF
jgi:hypothetical protein